MIQYYGALWEAAMQGGYIVMTSPSNRSSVPAAESAHAALSAGPRQLRGGSMPRSTINIDKSLDALSLTGIQSKVGTETTTAFKFIRADHQLEAAVDDYESNETDGDAGFDLCMIININRVDTTGRGPPPGASPTWQPLTRIRVLLMSMSISTAK